MNFTDSHTKEYVIRTSSYDYLTSQLLNNLFVVSFSLNIYNCKTLLVRYSLVIFLTESQQKKNKYFI